MTKINQTRGFTLIELLIVVAIIGILAAIAYPSYQGYIERSHRADTMSELQNIAATIKSRKLAQGRYSNALIAGLGGSFPRQGTALYTISFSDPLTSEWTITASPIDDTRMADDGDLSLDYRGYKCRDTTCGTGDEWK
ncbi:type IV pilin protein [Psychrobacter immobilis]|uniref:type IV pilin protein n=1 Tax=Psychrobacter immobilis TaxID=498 RepID=UPI0028EA806F|nr:type IV pilin protein [Psychrobacter immobilis]